MATLFDLSASLHSRCFACGALVYAVEKKLTTNHVYHNRCFRCRICKRNLTGYSLNEEGEDIYCTNCYRRKLRGDCNSFEFYRAAAEKAQYVHNRFHPEQNDGLINTRSRSFREPSRNPSLTLRQLERQFLSYREPKSNNHTELINSNASTPLVASHPLTINTNFSTPINFTNLRHSDLLTAKNEPSSTVRTEAKITPWTGLRSSEIITNDEPANPTGTGTGGIEFRLNKSTVDLSTVTLSTPDRRNVAVVPNLRDSTDSKLHLQDLNIASIRRRSASAYPFKKLVSLD